MVENGKSLNISLHANSQSSLSEKTSNLRIEKCVERNSISLSSNSHNFIIHCTSGLYFPIVKNSRSPISPIPGLIIPLSSISSSQSPTQISTCPSAPSAAALISPGALPSTDITSTFLTPHSSSVWIAATEVPPVAIMGSRRMATSG